MGDWGYFSTPTAQNFGKELTFEFSFIPTFKKIDDPAQADLLTTQVRSFVYGMSAVQYHPYVGRLRCIF